MEEKEYRYYAFISYSHKDQETAKRLQKTLHRYHLPSKVLKSNPDLPKKLSPVFLDESNLVAVGPLDESLRRNLDASKYLIVICSPNSAQSKYVNDEVQYFIDNGKLGQIVPLIIDGEPYSDDPEKECFPPAIKNLPRKQELLGINMKVFHERGAFLRVIATLLGLNLEHFVDDEERRRRIRIAMFSAVAAVFMIAAGLLIWHNIPHEHYYHSYVYKWGKPVGLFEVKSESDRMKMEYTYRFTVLRGKVQKIERVNSAGTLVDPSIVTPLIELPMIRFVSDRTVEYYDVDRHKVYRKQYADDNMTAADFYCGDGIVPYALPSDTFDFYSSQKYNPEWSLSQNSGNIIRTTMEYDKNGHMIKMMFRSSNHGGKDRKGTPAQDSRGRYGFRYTLDNLGRVTEVYNLDRNGEAISVNGIYTVLYEYGDTPYPVKSAFVDKNGSLVTGLLGKAFDTVAYDKYFNSEKWSCYGPDGKRVLHTENKISEIVLVYDPENGFLTSMSYYDTELEPCKCKDGYFRIEYTRNKEGRSIKDSYYDVKGERTVCADGYASLIYEYNDDGRIIRMTFRDVEDRPAIDHSSNAYGYRYSYENGFEKRIDNLDADGNLMLNKNGYASMLTEYYEEDNKVAGLICKDTEGKNVMTSWGYAEMRMTYEDGNIASYEHYDEEGRLVPDSSGVAKYLYEWKNGSKISEKCFDASDKPVLNSNGYASAEYEYDDNGLKISERYYGADGKRIMLSGGYSAVKYAYDSRGNKTSETYFDADDKFAVLVKEYYCYSKEYDYDDNGNIKHIRYVREKNQQYQDMLDSQVQDEYFEYNNNRQDTAQYWLNGRGEKVDFRSQTKGGDIRREKEYDIYGRIIKRLYHKRSEENTCTIQEYKYDAFGRETGLYAVRDTPSGKDIIAEIKEYDIYGNCCRKYYLGEKNELIIPVKRFSEINIDYAVRKSRYDIFGHETDVWYYDENEEPLHTENRAFHTVKTYDSKGNVLTESYYHTENEDEPAELSGGFHRKICRYDARGHETERMLYDKDGKLIDGACHIRISYNSFGQTASIERYNSEGKPAVNAYNVFRYVYAYDSFGNTTDIWFFGVDGKPCYRIDDKGQFREHHQKYSYNAIGQKLSEEMFDTEEKPDSFYGIHKALYTYNSYGLLSEAAYYDKDQNWLKKKIYKYDSEGNKTGEEWVK